MDATIAQYPREMGRLTVISADRLLRGETVPAEQPVDIELVTRRQN
jgi:ABC-type sugar transport system substrate-binding protein